MPLDPHHLIILVHIPVMDLRLEINAHSQLVVRLPLHFHVNFFPSMFVKKILKIEVFCIFFNPTIFINPTIYYLCGWEVRLES